MHQASSFKNREDARAPLGLHSVGTMKRRTFLIGTLAGGAAAAAGAVLGTTRREPLPAPPAGLRVFDAAQAFTLLSVARRMVAPLDPVQLAIVPKIDAVFATLDASNRHDFKQLLGLLDNPLAGLAFDGRLTRFTELAPEAQDEALRQWRDSRIPDRRSGFQSLQRLCLAIAYAVPEVQAGIGYRGPPALVRRDGSAVGGDFPGVQ